MSLRFASPYYLLLLLPVAALVWLELRKRTGAVRFPDVSFLRARQGPGRALKAALLAINALALVLLVLALARPQRGRMIEEVESRGVDIMLCLDISESMLTGDLQPDRITAAKQRAVEFIGKRTGDRIGLVVFANGSMTLCPLTLDRSVLRDIIGRLRIGALDPTRTAIGMGLASAVARLKDSQARSKIVILLTDGLNNAGEVDPQTAAQLAVSYGIKVYCIGVGSQTPVTVMVNDPFWGARPRTVAADFDMKALEAIAAATDARAFAASDNEGLGQIYREIDRLEPTRFKTARHTLYSERAEMFLLPGAALFLIGLAIPTLLLRRLP
jgi:Ca-activated chloride channel family protein